MGFLTILRRKPCPDAFHIRLARTLAKSLSSSTRRQLQDLPMLDNQGRENPNGRPIQIVPDHALVALKNLKFQTEIVR